MTTDKMSVSDRSRGFLRMAANLALAVGLAISPAVAAETGQFSKKVLVKDNADVSKRKVVSIAKDVDIVMGAPGGSADPTLSGATIRIFGDESGAGDTGEISLAAANWSLLGTVASPKGYKYKESKVAPTSPCNLVKIVDGKLIKAVCRGKDVPLSYSLGGSGGPPGVDQGNVTTVLTTGTNTYCWAADDFAGKDGTDGTTFKGKDDAQLDGASSCPDHVGTSLCAFDATSRFSAISALGASSDPVTGGVVLDCGDVFAGNGAAECTCQVAPSGFGPIKVQGVSGTFLLCVKPAVSAGCPGGEIDCDGGNSLGLDIFGNRAIGGCASNADCATQCTVYCAPYPVGAAECEGFCSAGSQMPCSSDAQCQAAGEGACYGTNLLPYGSICDCTCVGDGAGGPSSAGDLMCRLEANLTIEPFPGNGMECDGADVTIDIGDTCIPLTTQSVDAILNNANNSGGTLPVGGFSDAGIELSCTDLNSGISSGSNLVGATMLYATPAGDINARFDLVCQ